ncbi:MAG: thiamine-phosphate kinase, partial [Actinotalea sp.]|nr:thiamine-phosphate kinase [Actinotalea sp.]
VLAHAGELGRSAAGHALLAAGRVPEDSGDAARAAVLDAVARYRSPRAPLDAGRAAALAGATAMLDVSDGLLRDAGRLARASGVRLDLAEPTDVLAADLAAVAPAAALLGGATDLPLEWVLTGGEDHGLLATFPPTVPVPAPFRRIGSVLAAGEPAVLVAGAPPRAGSVGWDHFRR